MGAGLAATKNLLGYGERAVNTMSWQIPALYMITLLLVLLLLSQTALCVEVVGGTDTSVTITLLPYDHGDAPVRMENLCDDVFIKLHQK